MIRNYVTKEKEMRDWCGGDGPGTWGWPPSRRAPGAWPTAGRARASGGWGRRRRPPTPTRPQPTAPPPATWSGPRPRRYPNPRPPPPCPIPNAAAWLLSVRPSGAQGQDLRTAESGGGSLGPRSDGGRTLVAGRRAGRGGRGRLDRGGSWTWMGRRRGEVPRTRRRWWRWPVSLLPAAPRSGPRLSVSGDFLSFLFRGSFGLLYYFWGRNWGFDADFRRFWLFRLITVFSFLFRKERGMLFQKKCIHPSTNVRNYGFWNLSINVRTFFFV